MPVAPRKFFFKPEKLKKQCSESKQGPSYQVWLPWDPVGGPSKQVNLWTRFDGISQGAVVMSDNSPQLLPGVSRIAAATKPLPAPQATPHGQVSQAGYETPSQTAEKGAAEESEPNQSTAASSTEWWK